MPLRLLVATGLVLGLSSLAASAGERLVVVELFTSQGCSSCPPANAFLNELARTDTDVLPLAFHVTYWDRLGWKDPFSLREATARQAAYGRRFGDGSYTPEIVVDGAVGLVGSRRAEVTSAIEAAKRVAIPAAALSVVKSNAGISIEVGSGTGRGEILLVGFDHEHVTAIRRGENGGRTLEEANVVRSARVVGTWSGNPVRIEQSLPAGEDGAVLLQAADGRILAASRLPTGDGA